MIYRFKSKATADLIVMGPVGDNLLRIAGREPAAKGIIELGALPAAIAAIEAAVEAEEAVRTRSGAEEPEESAGGDNVSLRQRAWPLLEMMRRAQREGADIVWGV